MKAKKFDKKLALNKKTIADLSNSEMGKIQGGVLTTVHTCFATECTKCFTNCAAGVLC